MWVLPRLIGLDHAAEMFYSGWRVGAEEAVERGLVTRAVADEDLDQEVDRLTSSMMTGSRRSLRALKQLMRSGLEQRPAEHLLMQHHFQQSGDPTVDQEAFAQRFRR